MRPSSVSSLPSASRIVLLALGLIAVFGCKQAEPAPPPAKAPELQAAPAPAPPPAEPQPPSPPTAADDPAGWSRISQQDNLPLCVFPSYQAREASPPFPNVKKQTLKANAPLVSACTGRGV